MERTHRIVFTATAGEYFRLWIVNLFLTLVTLGIYSAWAKVRKKRYFYEHTLLEGEAFEYRGQPLAILKGRLFAVAVVATVYGVSHLVPSLLWVVLIAAVFVIPWLIVRSYAFNAHNSVYRNVRMKFDGTYGRALKLFVGYGLLTIITLGLGYFYLKTRLTEFVVRSHSYGATRFAVPDLKKSFFAAYARMIGLGLVAGLVITSSSMLVFSVAPGLAPDSFVWIAYEIFVYAMYLGIYAYVRSRILNATWNQATLGPLRFVSTLRARGLFALYATNILAIVVTLGLAAPWAVVRTHRYRADHLCAVSTEGLDGFAASAGGSANATGEEIAEMMDFDFSI